MASRKVHLHPYTEGAVREFCPAVSDLLPANHVGRVTGELPDRFTLVLSPRCLLSFPCPARFRGLFYRELKEEFDADAVEALRVDYEEWMNSIT